MLDYNNGLLSNNVIHIQIIMVTPSLVLEYYKYRKFHIAGIPIALTPVEGAPPSRSWLKSSNNNGNGWLILNRNHQFS